MLITYVDESERDRQVYFIGALTVSRDALVQIETGLDELVKETASQVSSLPTFAELHGWDVFHGEGQWEGVPPRLRVHVSLRTIRIIAETDARFVIRGTNRPGLTAKYSQPHPIHELTLSHALEETNARIVARHGHDARALVIADEHHTAEDGRRRFKSLRASAGGGFAMRPLTQMVDTMYFGPSHHSRLLQAADMATFFSNRVLTIKETDPRSARAMDELKADLDRITDDRYIWLEP